MKVYLEPKEEIADAVRSFVLFRKNACEMGLGFMNGRIGSGGSFDSVVVEAILVLLGTVVTSKSDLLCKHQSLDLYHLFSACTFT